MPDVTGGGEASAMHGGNSSSASGNSGQASAGGAPALGRVLAGSEPSNTPMYVVSPVDDYVRRGERLAPCSPVMMSMWFRKVKMTPEEQLQADAAQFSRLSSDHPQFHTHRWQQSRQPALIQIISDPPPQPSAAAADEREAYAAWAEGNFGAYTADADGRLSIAQPYWPLLQRLSDPQDQSDATRVARHFLCNAQSRALARLRGDARRAALAAHAEGEGDAAAALRELVPDADTLVPVLSAEELQDAHAAGDDDDAALEQQNLQQYDDETPPDLAAATASACDTPLTDAGAVGARRMFSMPPPAGAVKVCAALQSIPPLQLRAVHAAGAAQQAAPAAIGGVTREAVAHAFEQQKLYGEMLQHPPDQAEQLVSAQQRSSGVLHLSRGADGIGAILTPGDVQGAQNRRASTSASCRRTCCCPPPRRRRPRTPPSCSR